MSYDLGLNHEAEDDKYIKNAIQELESTYHLVLLTDYFEEVGVVGWPFTLRENKELCI